MPSNDPDYSNLEEAEAVFHKLLRRIGVQPEWTWMQTVKATVKDPQYRAIKDPKDRKAAWERYGAEVRAQDKDRERDRQAKLRTDFYSMLKTHPEIRHYTRWSTAKDIVEGETIFRAAKTEQEAQAIFNDYRADLLKAHNESESNRRKSALDRLVTLLRDLDLGPYTRWTEANKALQADTRYQGDETFTSLSKIDLLKAFENHIKALERTFNDKRQREKAEKARKDRQNRDAFNELLKDLRSAGKIKAGTKWTDIHDLIEDDPRYVAMLGQAGSTPLDLFWDMVEEEDRSLRNKRNDALDVLEVRCSHDFHYDPLTDLTRINVLNSPKRLHSKNLLL
jgi:pre-mRNA-processing factor 40